MGGLRRHHRGPGGNARAGRRSGPDRRPNRGRGRRGGEDQVLAHHVAAHPAVGYPAPNGPAAQHDDGRPVRDGDQGTRAGAGVGAQDQPAARHPGRAGFALPGRGRRGGPDRDGRIRGRWGPRHIGNIGRRRRRYKAQIAGHHIAGGAAVGHPGPGGSPAQDRHSRPVRDIQKGDRAGAGGGAQVQPPARHHGKGIGSRRRRRPRGHRGTNRGRRGGGRRRILGELEVSRQHIAGFAGIDDLRPDLSLFQHLHVLPVGDAGQGSSRHGLRFPEGQQAAAGMDLRHGHGRLGRPGRRGGGDDRLALAQDQVAGHHIALPVVPADQRPGGLVIHHAHRTAVGKIGQGAGQGAAGGADSQGSAGSGNDRGGRHALGGVREAGLRRLIGPAGRRQSKILLEGGYRTLGRGAEHAAGIRLIAQ